jgi:aspartate/methionine/tyrosine aminotransferase
MALRVGESVYQVIPAHLDAAVLKAQDTNLICAPLISQAAATAALGAGRDYSEAYRSSMARVRQLVLGEWKPCGIVVRCPLPKAPFTY